MKAILLIDHGSRRDEANHMLACMAALVQHMAGERVVVRHAHMELAEPDIATGFAACVDAGADEIIAFPYMLSPGRHSTSDIPRLVTEAAATFPGVRFAVTPAFGVHERLGELILHRAGVVPVTLEPGERCWDDAGCVGECGDGCRALTGGKGDAAEPAATQDAAISTISR
jgi:sirohydrochlorin ferrochelatase